jgi:hypothetical protein
MKANEKHNKHERSHCLSGEEECESTVTMRLRCRRLQLVTFIPAFLILFSLASNARILLRLSASVAQPPPDIVPGYPNRSLGQGTGTMNSSESEPLPEKFDSIVEHETNSSAVPEPVEAPIITPMDQADDTSSSLKDTETNSSAIENTTNATELPAKKIQTLSSKPKTNQQKQKRKMRRRTPNIPPRQESMMHNATFSSCLLIKDDNDILPEWIAYVS